MWGFEGSVRRLVLDAVVACVTMGAMVSAAFGQFWGRAAVTE
jgi:hypothetical protein